MKRFALLSSAIGMIAAFAFVGGAGAAPTPSPSALTISLTGKTGISLSSSDLPAGAVNISATSSTGHGSFGLVQLNNGVTVAQAFAAVQSHHGDLNALNTLGTLFVSADAPGTVQANLTQGDNYVALNTTGQGAPVFTTFKVHNNPNAAPLSAPAATETSIEFAFKGPSKLTAGSLVRAVNGGFLVHMDNLIGVKSKAAGKSLIGLLRRGASRKKTKPFINGHFFDLMDPASPGAVQQLALNTKPGWYVQACFMNTEDGREHTQLGMERLVHVVK